MTTGWRAPSGFAAIPGVVMSPNGPAAVTPLDEAEQKLLCAGQGPLSDFRRGQAETPLNPAVEILRACSLGAKIPSNA
jgi:hypothetical protein